MYLEETKSCLINNVCEALGLVQQCVSAGLIICGDCCSCFHRVIKVRHTHFGATTLTQLPLLVLCGPFWSFSYEFVFFTLVSLTRLSPAFSFSLSHLIQHLLPCCWWPPWHPELAPLTPLPSASRLSSCPFFVTLP